MRFQNNQLSTRQIPICNSEYSCSIFRVAQCRKDRIVFIRPLQVHQHFVNKIIFRYCITVLIGYVFYSFLDERPPLLCCLDSPVPLGDSVVHVIDNAMVSHIFSMIESPLNIPVCKFPVERASSLRFFNRPKMSYPNQIEQLINHFQGHAASGMILSQSGYRTQVSTELKFMLYQVYFCQTINNSPVRIYKSNDKIAFTIFFNSPCRLFHNRLTRLIDTVKKHPIRWVTVKGSDNKYH